MTLDRRGFVLATTALSLETPTRVHERAAQVPPDVLNVRAFGAAGDAVTDDTEAIRSAIAAAATQGGHIVFVPPGTYVIADKLGLPEGVILRGTGSCRLLAGPAFPDDTPMVEIGVPGETYTHRSRVEALQLDCNHVPGSVGVYSARANERCGLVDVGVLRYMAYGVHFAGEYSQNYMLEHLELMASLNAAAGATHGVYLENCRSKGTLVDISVVPQATGTGDVQGSGIEIEGSHNVIMVSIHVEDHRYGIHFNNSFGSVVGYTGNDRITDGVRIEPTDRRVFLSSIQANLGPNAVHDVGPGIALGGNIVPFYAAAGDNTALYPVAGGVGLRDDLDAAGGHRQTIDGWYQEDARSGQSAVALNRNGETDLRGRWVAPRDGSVTAVAVKSTRERTAGSAWVEVFRSGSATGLVAGLDQSAAAFNVATVPKSAVAFSRGDELEIRLTTNGAWRPTNSTIVASLEVET